MEKTLAGKTALVTGGSRGPGKAIAEQLAAEGALVAVNYAENRAAAAATVARIALDRAMFVKVVRDGASLSRGMPRYGDFSDEQLGQLYSYVRAMAREEKQRKSPTFRQVAPARDRRER